VKLHPVEEIPFIDGKFIDYRQLEKLGSRFGDTTTDDQQSLTETEKKLVKIWGEILGRTHIGINDNFFELGGHSLNATILLSQIYKEFDVNIPISIIFEKPTVGELAKHIEEAAVEKYISITAVEKREYYLLSSAQKRMYILQQLDRKATIYNMPAAFELTGSLDVRRLQETFLRLIERHESLRTSFIMLENESEPVQRVHPIIDFEVKYLPVQAGSPSNNNLVRPFDLSRIPLLRVGLIKKNEKNLIMVIDMHHILSDGVSMEILVREFMILFAREELPLLRLQYKDFSMWQNKFFQSDEMKKKEKFWLDKFKGDIPSLDMPTSYPRPPARDFRGDLLTAVADKTLTEQLNDLAKKSDTTLFMVLLAAFNVLLFQYTGKSDIVVGSPLAGRVHPDLDNVMGMFVNTLALRNYPGQTKTFNRFLQEVKENTLQAYENQDYQLEMLVDKLHLPREAGKNPLFDTLFALQNVSIPKIKLKNLELKSYKLNTGMSHFDIILTGVETHEGIVFSLKYSTQLFSREMMETFILHFINLLKEIVKSPGAVLTEIDVRSESEKKKISQFRDLAQGGSYEF
jgi:fengycin family lipopeptide synthetase D